jgi:mannosylglucosylglycerate synthase
MKIAICHYSCPPVIGGVETVVEQQARLLKRNHHSTKVIAGSGGKFSQSIDVDINPMLSSGIMDIQNHTQDRDVSKLMEPQILSILGFLEYSLSSFEVLLVHNVLTMPHNLPLTHAILRMAQKSPLKVISWNHDSPFFSPEPKGGWPASWEVLKTPLPGITYVTVSNARKRDFESLYGGTRELKVIPGGISTTNFLKLKELTTAFVTEKRLVESDIILLQPGRYHPGKNLELSVKVVRSLLDRGVNVSLLLTATIDPHDIGSIEYHDRIKKLVEEEGVGDHILFVSDYVYRKTASPNIDRSLLRDLYHVADMLFMPSVQEGYGITLLEAAAARLPIACSDIPLFREMCEADACLFPLNETPGEVAARIEGFAAHGPMRMFKRVFRNYSWDSIYQEKLAHLLKEALESR